MKCFVIIAPHAETAQSLVAQRLLFKNRCVQGILELKIQHKIFNHFIFRIIKKLFDNERANDYIYRSIRSGCLIMYKTEKRFSSIAGNISSAKLLPGFFQCALFPGS